ncbi:glycosyltransferase family 4 protein [Microvirga sp. 3-52]|uniref:glycosyltransferase family 4 protein n=1 Tax=Microvirga sp. 3-52 TaxID=2792425 RepID=UPI001AD51877|nr:glycosyltransferase family 4 protein [Microvirga sp. 3-52]MBO1904284.1 glycosyltransferase family 4 protein [Microvirga sp. 3-52]MBS7451543.1 glycosyltransferase family 4 protein [Microvirga sp. 3-52]
MTTRVLVVAHNHPNFHPGGTEIFAHDLFSEYRSRPDVTALFLAATNNLHRGQRPGTSFQSPGDAADEVVMWCGHFDQLNLSQIDSYGVVPHIVSLLEDFRPDIVHIHHVLLIGVEFIALVRRILPDARIVMTLHDYYPICAHDGLMMRTKGRERCDRATPNRCNGCFPDVAADRFLLREKYIQTHFGQVHRFIAPSRFIKERFVSWGLSPDSIEVVANGRPATVPAAHRRTDSGRRSVFGYFGNLNPWKGIPTLLKATQRLVEEGFDDFELRLHGGAPFQSNTFVEEIDKLIAKTEPHVVRLGPYSREDILNLMTAVDWVVVPSIWWENAPLVIQEAFIHRRPVLVSGIGGMAEAVRDGIDGLHVRPDDPVSLASAMRKAIETPGLWDSLAARINPPADMTVVAERHLALYRDLLRGAEIIELKADAA